MHSTFIDKFPASDPRPQFLGNSLGELTPQALHARRLPLAVVERLFFRGSPKTCNVRHIMLGLAATPWASTTRSHSSANVTSDCCLTAARMKASQAWSVRPGPRPGGKAAQLPVSRQRYHHFSRVDLWRRNRAATWAWVSWPAARTAIARSRKSCE